MTQQLACAALSCSLTCPQYTSTCALPSFCIFPSLLAMLSFCQVTKKPTANCAGKSNFKVHGQVRTNAQLLQDKCHTFDNCHTCLTFLSPQPETRTGALVWKLRQGGMQDLHRRRGKPQTPNNPTTLNPEPESRNPPTTNLHPPLPTLSPSPGAGRWL